MRKIKKQDVLCFFNTDIQFKVLSRKYASALNKREKSRIFSPIQEGKLTAYLMVTPTFENIGDHAIVSAELQFLEKYWVGNIVEITLVDLLKYYQEIRNNISEKDLICIQGGGNMGTEYLAAEILRRKIISDFATNKKIIFPQTIYYGSNIFSKISKFNSKKVYNEAKNLIVCAREEKSFNDMKKTYDKAEVIFVPDIVLQAKFNYKKPDARNESILLCLRNDEESVLTEENKNKFNVMLKKTGREICLTDMLSKDNISQQERENVINKKLELFAGSSLVITDRIHGMIFAALTGTPCIVVSNYNHKVEETWKIISRQVHYIKFVNDYNYLETTVFSLLDNECRTIQVPYAFENKDFESIIEEVLHNK